MAIAKIHAIKSTLNKSIDYITDSEKTTMKDGTRLVSSYGCGMETAAVEFKMTANLAEAIKGDYSKVGGANNLAYHMIQSFAIPDNEKVTPEQIHELGKKFAEEFLGGQYEYVIATHIDKKHVHNHIIFNATSYETLKKFRSEPFKTVKKIRAISDRICWENNLSVIEPKGRGKSYYEWLMQKNGGLTWKETIRNKIDEIIPSVVSYDEFVAKMEDAGIQIKEGKDIAFKILESMQKFHMNGKTIGSNYTREKIKQRIAKNKVATHGHTVETLFWKEENIPLSEYLKSRHAQRKETLHMAAQAVAYSRTEGVLYYKDFSARISELRKTAQETNGVINILDDKMVEMKEAGRLLITYNKFLPIKQESDRLKKHMFKFASKKFDQIHELDLISFSYANDELQKRNINPEEIDGVDLINKIKTLKKEVEDHKEEYHEILQRIDKIAAAQKTIEEFLDVKPMQKENGQHIINKNKEKNREENSL